MSLDSQIEPSNLKMHTPSANEIVRVNLLVPATLRKEWKAIALASDKTLTDFIIEAMQHQINRAKQTEKKNELN